MTELIEGQETNLSDTDLPDLTEEEAQDLVVGYSGPPILKEWKDISLLDIPDDAVTPEGISIWEIIEGGTGLNKKDVEDIQNRHLDSKGNPVSLYMVGIGNFTFLIREVTIKLHRQIIQGCHLDEQAYIKQYKNENKGKEEENFTIPADDRQGIEEINTIKVALVWPSIGTGENQFDPEDEDLPFLVTSGLFTKILEASGAYDMPILKKV